MDHKISFPNCLRPLASRLYFRVLVRHNRSSLSEQIAIYATSLSTRRPTGCSSFHSLLWKLTRVSSSSISKPSTCRINRPALDRALPAVRLYPFLVSGQRITRGLVIGFNLLPTDTGCFVARSIIRSGVAHRHVSLFVERVFQ